MKLIAKVIHIFDHIVYLAAVFGAALLMFTMLAVCAEVVARYFLNRPMLWVTEVTEYCLLLITFLGATWVLKREGHVKMDLIVARLKSRAQAVLNLVTSIVCGIVCLGLIWYGAKVTGELFQSGYFLPTILEPPKWPFVAIIPLSGFLLFFQFLRRAHGYAWSLRTSQDHEQRSHTN